MTLILGALATIVGLFLTAFGGDILKKQGKDLAKKMLEKSLQEANKQ